MYKSANVNTSASVEKSHSYNTEILFYVQLPTFYQGLQLIKEFIRVHVFLYTGDLSQQFIQF